MLRGNAGDSAAYHAFLRELSAHLRGFFRKRLSRMPDEVEDLVQETLLAVHNHRETYKEDEPLTPWIHAIARYKLADLLRRRSGREALTDPLEDDIDVLASPESEAMDARHDVESLLEQLPERQRLLIQYLRLDGLSVVEAAQLTGMSESAVKVGLHRALKTLTVRMRGHK